MSALVTVLVVLLLGILAVLALALILPVHITCRLRKDTGVAFLVEARPFGGASPGLSVADSRRKRPKPKPRAKAKEKNKGGALFRRPGFASAVPEFVTGLLGCIHLERIALDAEFGCDDPADTGHIFGALTPLLYGVYGMPRSSVAVRPVFDGRCLTGTCDMCLSVTPIHLIAPFWRFGWRVFGPRS